MVFNLSPSGQNGGGIIDDYLKSNLVNENWLFYWSLFLGIWLMRSHHWFR